MLRSNVPGSFKPNVLLIGITLHVAIYVELSLLSFSQHNFVTEIAFKLIHTLFVRICNNNHRCCCSFSVVVQMAEIIFQEFLDTNEKRNFWSIETLSKKVAPGAVRNCFDTLVPPNKLASVLNNNIEIVKDLWKNKHILKKDQLNVLLGVPGVKIPVWAGNLSIKTGKI